MDWWFLFSKFVRIKRLKKKIFFLFELLGASKIILSKVSSSTMIQNCKKALYPSLSWVKINFSLLSDIYFCHTLKYLYSCTPTTPQIKTKECRKQWWKGEWQLIYPIIDVRKHEALPIYISLGWKNWHHI